MTENAPTVAGERVAAETATRQPPTDLFCNQCGVRLPLDSKFCNYCGAKIVPPYEEEKARVEPRQEVQAPKPPASLKGITWWVIPLSLFLLFVILPLISYSIFSPSSSSPSSSPSSSRAVPRLVPDVQVFNTGNGANDMILALPESKQSYGLGVIVNSAGYSCVGQRTFYMGISPKDQFAYWSIGCTNGQSYQVEFAPNAGGSTKVLDCRILQVVAKGDCFVKLEFR
jgi:hypothetical protein